MRLSDHQHKKLILVCVNVREDGAECCGQKGSLDLYHKLKAAVKEEAIGNRQKAGEPIQNIRVSKTGCLGNCESGITVALMPENVYLGEVTEADIPEIVRRIVE